MFTLPDLSALSLLELRALLQQALAAGVAELAKPEDEIDFEFAETVADAKTEIEAAIEAAETAETAAEAEAAEKAAARTARLAATFTIGEAADEVASRTPAVNLPEDAPAGEGEPAAEAEAGTESAAAETVEEKPAKKTAAKATIHVAERLTAMQAARKAEEKPAFASIDAEYSPFASTARLARIGINQGDTLTFDQMVEAVVDRTRNRSAVSVSGEFDHLFVSKINYGDLNLSGMDAEGADAVLRSIGRTQREALTAAAGAGSMSDLEALVASGGSCAPLTPRYGIAQYAQAQSPVWDSLATTGDDSRGGVSYTEMPDSTYLSAALLINDCANSIAKPFVQVNQCPTMRDICVRPMSKRYRFDNQMNRTYPEFIRWSMMEMAVIEAATREVFMLNRIVQESRPVQTIANPYGYGSARSSLAYITAIAHNIRKRNNLNVDGNVAVINMYCPDSYIETFKVDMINDGFFGSQFLAAPTVTVKAELLRKWKINLVGYYYNSSEVGFPASSHAGPEADWELPTVGRFIFEIPGSLSKIDGGELDVGLVRDSTLNTTNDVEYFSEMWFELMRPGIRPSQYDMTFSTSGAGPLGVPAVGAP